MTAPFGEEISLDRLREEIGTLLEVASAKITEQNYDTTTTQLVIASSQKKRFALRGYSHHIAQRPYEVYSLEERYGVTNFGDLVRNSGLRGVTDSQGSLILKNHSLFSSGEVMRFTWQIVDLNDVPLKDLYILRQSLITFMST